MTQRSLILFGGVALLYLLTGMFFSWNLSLSILNASLIGALMAQGVNMQWGYAGLFNTGVMGFVALGGLGVVLASSAPVPEGWAAGGPRLIGALIIGALIILGAVILYRKMAKVARRGWILTAYLVAGFFLFRAVFDPAVDAIEAFNPSTAGNLGGLGLPILLSWPVGGLIAAAAAWAIGKTALGLRSDYLAIATLGIAEIVIAVMKNEDWLGRGVKMVNLTERPWPVPKEVELQVSPWFLNMTSSLGLDPVGTSTIVVKLAYAMLFIIILGIVIWLAERALNSPWGRMMRAIRDNEVAAAAMGKNIIRRHLQVFVLGSAVIGIAGAMMTTLDGILNPGTYQPLRFTFLIWVMVIVGGSGNNWGAVLGALLIGWLYLIVEALGPNLMTILTSGLSEGPLKDHLIDSGSQMRLLLMGLLLLVVLRFNPRGLLPEK
jgi:branched-chain amino acid transport system permease protein